MAKAAWGIDIGGSSVKVAKLAEGKEGLELAVLDVFEMPVSEDDLAERNARITTLLGTIKEKYRFRKSDVIYFSIPGHTVFHRAIPIFAVEEKKAFRELIEHEAQQQIPFPIVDIIWDYQVNSAEITAGEEVEVTLYAVRRDIIQNFLNVLGTAELPVAGIQVAPLALYNYARFDRGMDMGIVLDIGAENTDLVVVENSKCWMRNINTASNQITHALEKRFQIPFAEAEKLKLKAPKSKQAEKIYELLKPTLRELVAEINRSMGFYKSQSESTSFDQLLLLGNGSKLLGLKHFFEENFPGFSITKVASFEKVKIGEDVDPALYQNNVASFGVAMGLALQGIGRAENSINLAPPELKGVAEKARNLPWVYACLGVLYLALLTWGLATRFEANSVTKFALDAKSTENRVRSLQKAREKARDNALYQEENQKVAGIGATRDAWTWVAMHLAAAVHAFNRKGVVLPGGKEPGKPLALTFVNPRGTSSDPRPALRMRHMPYNLTLEVTNIPGEIKVAAVKDSVVTALKEMKNLNLKESGVRSETIGGSPPDVPPTGLRMSIPVDFSYIALNQSGNLPEDQERSDPMGKVLARLRATLAPGQTAAALSDDDLKKQFGISMDMFSRWRMGAAFSVHFPTEDPAVQLVQVENAVREHFLKDLEDRMTRKTSGRSQRYRGAPRIVLSNLATKRDVSEPWDRRNAPLEGGDQDYFIIEIDSEISLTQSAGK